jgi:hypothetical protein
LVFHSRRQSRPAAVLVISTRQLRDLTRTGSIGYIDIGQLSRVTRRERDRRNRFVGKRSRAMKERDGK